MRLLSRGIKSTDLLAVGDIADRTWRNMTAVILEKPPDMNMY